MSLHVYKPDLLWKFSSCYDDYVLCETVKSKDLVWLPNGSKFTLDSEGSNSSSKSKTYTSFSCSQDSLPEFSSNPIGPTHGDITIARLGPGQVTLLPVFCGSG